MMSEEQRVSSDFQSELILQFFSPTSPQHNQLILRLQPPTKPFHMKGIANTWLRVWCVRMQVL